MKMRKLAAVLSAAAVAVTSLSVSAFAADVAVGESDTIALVFDESGAVSGGDDGVVAIKKDGTPVTEFLKGDTVTVTVEDVVDGTTEIKVNDVAATVSGSSATATLTANNASSITLSGKSFKATKVAVTRAAAAESTPAESTPAETDDPDAPGGDVTAPTVTFPSGEQTLTLAANSWGDAPDTHSNYQANVALFSEASIAAVNAMTGTVTIKVNLKDMSIGTGDKLNVMAIVQSSGGVWETVGSGNFASSTTATISVPATSIIEKANTADEGDTINLLVAFGTATDDPAFTEAPVIKYTFGDEAAPAPGGGDETTTAAPAPGAPAEPNIRPVAPAASEAPAATEAPEVVTAANGESVEAAKDVVPSGAALEVKEQSKEEAVKAVEAVKATDANKEVVETIKKAVEDDKAAVVDIDLVKDGAKVQPNGSIKVTINVPEALKDAAKLFVYRVEADGTFTDVQATVEGGKIVFTTSHFSTYIITSEALSGDAVVTEAAATTAPETTPEKPDDKNQATGVILAVIPAMIAAAGVVVSKKRK